MDYAACPGLRIDLIFLSAWELDYGAAVERQLMLTIRPDEAGRILFYGVSALHPKKQGQATWVMRTYAGLLRLQLDASKPELRPSVRKLLAQGNVEIMNGRYRVKAKLES